MKMIPGCFVSQILGSNVYDTNNIYLGKLKDIILSSDEHTPSIIAIKLGTHDGNKKLAFSSLEVYKDGRYKIIIKEPREFASFKNCYSLRFDIMDKQIVDIDGRRVVRVNDLRLAYIGGFYRVIAVDVGFTGLLRRLSILRISEKAANLLNFKMKDSLILWDNVEPLTGHVQNLTLSMSYKKLKSLHPADIADILEDLDINYRSNIFNTFDTKLAADTLEEFETEYQTDLIENLDENRTREIFENMPNDEVADILDEIDEEQAAKILEKMDIEDAREIKELLGYDDDTVGSIMSKDYIVFDLNTPVHETIKNLRETKPSSEIAYYLYTVDEAGKLLGVVSLRDLIVSEPELKLSDIMSKNVISIKDTEDLDDLTEIVVKYDLLAIPVVNEDNVLLGMAILNDIVDEVLMPRWKRILKKAV